MENEKIENRVILTLEEYLKMRDLKIKQDDGINELVNLLFDCVELNNDKTDLNVLIYSSTERKIKILLKELNPEKYQKRLETLQKEKEEE